MVVWTTWRKKFYCTYNNSRWFQLVGNLFFRCCHGFTRYCWTCIINIIYRTKKGTKSSWFPGLSNNAKQLTMTLPPIIHNDQRSSWLSLVVIMQTVTVLFHTLEWLPILGFQPKTSLALKGPPYNWVLGRGGERRRRREGGLGGHTTEREQDASEKNKLHHHFISKKRCIEMKVCVSRRVCILKCIACNTTVGWFHVENEDYTLFSPSRNMFVGLLIMVIPKWLIDATTVTRLIFLWLEQIIDAIWGGWCCCWFFDVSNFKLQSSYIKHLFLSQNQN